MDQGFDSNGKRQTARLPFTSGDASSGGQSLGGQRFNQSDVYATRIGDDFDDVLDVPVQPQAGYQTVDEVPPVPVFEDLYTAAQSQDQTSPYDFAAYDKPPTTQGDNFRTGGVRQRETPGYVEQTEQDFVGWPVLPEGSEEEEEATGSGRGGLFLRIGLVVGLVGVLCFWAYYFFGDYIAKRIWRQDQTAVLQTADPSANAGASEQPPSQTPESQATPNTQDGNTPPGGAQGSSETATTESARPKDEQGDPVTSLFRTPQRSPRNDRSKDKPVDLRPAPKPEGLVGPNGPSEPPRPSPGARSRLTVQVGSFKDQGEADVKASSLNAATSGEFHVVRAVIPGMGVWYRVQQVDGFASREAALNYGNRLRARNLISTFIVTTR